MIDFFRHILCPIMAITYVVVWSAVFAPARQRLKPDAWLGKLVRCGICTAAWAGILTGMINMAMRTMTLPAWSGWIVEPVLDLCCGIAFYFLLELIFGKE